MKIFLNNRIIEFVTSFPEVSLPSDLVIPYESPGKLSEVWKNFERYEKFRNLVIVDAGCGMRDAGYGMRDTGSWMQDAETAFDAFLSLFRFIPAAGGLVKNELGEFLFIHRLGHWDLPKGKINKKDYKNQASDPADPVSARNAAIREVKEETGLKSVTITRQLPSTWHIYTTKEKQILKQTFWFEMEANSSQTLKPQTSEGIFLVKWTSPAAIHCILSHTYASIRELLLETIF